MQRSIAALDIFAAVTALATCNNGTTSSPSFSDSVTTGTVTILAIQTDDTCFTQVETLAESSTTSTDVRANVIQKSRSDVDIKFTTRVPTGNSPDLAAMTHDKLGVFVTNDVISPMNLGRAESNFADVTVKTVTYNGQTYGAPYTVGSMVLVHNSALTKDEPKTYGNMVTSGKTAGVEYPFIIQMGDRGDPYHFYGFQISFSALVLNTNANGEYTSKLATGGSGGTDFATWPRTQTDVNVFFLSITADIVKQVFLDDKAAYTVAGSWNVTAFREAGMDISVLSIPSAGFQTAQLFVGVQMFYRSARSANPVTVKQFFDHLATPETQEETQKPGDHASVTPSVATKSDDQDIKDFAKAVKPGALTSTIPAMSFIWNFWGQTKANTVSDAKTSTGGWVTMVININSAITSR